MLPWFQELQHLVTRETRFISMKRNLGIDLASISLSGVCTPLKVRCIPEPLRQTYVEGMRAAMPNSVVVKLHDYAWNTAGSDPEALELVNVEKLRARKYCAKSLIEHGKNKDAIPLLEQLLRVEDQSIAYEACKLLINSYIAAGQPEAAVDLYVQAIMDNPHLLRTLDSRIVSSVCENLASSSKNISIPIALSFHYRYIDDAYDAALRYSFERFLNINCLNSPLELFAASTIHEQKRLYFLEYICIPDVMKLYLFFDNAKEIEECRIEICKRLVEKRHSVERMVSEVKERTRRQVLLEATKHVENSRIYSETDGFMASTEYRLLYDRFNKFRSQDYTEYDDESGLANLYETLKKDPLIMSYAYSMHVQDIVLNEKNTAFLKLCKIARDEFTFGVKGLSGHLSTRIRHGHFPNTLRKCVSSEGLLSPKPKSSSGYKRNSVWPDRFSSLPASSIASVDKTLAEFSSKYDTLINEVNDRWFQINVFDQEMTGLDKGTLTESALFNYSTTAFESYCLQRHLQETAEYSDFVKLVTQWLWDRTEQNLEIIRNKISADFRARSHRLLDDLENEVVKIVGASDAINEFRASVNRARVSLTAAIDTVICWFRRSQGLTVPKFDSDIAVTIARRSADADIEHFDSSNIEFQGRTLSYLVDVLYVLLENCVTKSNLPKGELNIQTRLERGLDGAALSVSNNCAPVEDISAANQALEYYRESYGKEAFALKASQGEGGSGFFKVWKSLAKDLGLAHEIVFGYESAERFVVSILISNSELEKVSFHEDIDR
ncbi:MAG: tetratricopeptide repeat protein [Aeromicrobium sp.]|nr:MAG: tetratricopeptide repeat protein [Aeromicrobium sp.]